MRRVSNKAGFTLTELMLVIAIIVILAGALSVGIAIDYNKYNNYLKSIKGWKCSSCGYEYSDRNDPDSHPASCPKCGGGSWEVNEEGYWEYNARDWVNGIFERSASEAAVLRESIASSESESRAIRASQEASARASREAAEESARLSREAEESARLSREAEERNSGNGGVDEGDDDTPVVGGGSAGAVTAANTSSNASGASVSVSGYWGGSNANMSFSVNKQVKEFTFWVPDEVVGGSISSNTGNCTYSYNGNFFTVTMTYGSTDGSGFSINAPNGHSFDPSKIVLYSYVPGSAT